MIVELSLELEGPVLARDPVTPADLSDARAEAWYNGFLRRGYPDAALGDVDLALRPIYKDDTCLGFSIESETPDGEAVRCVFPRAALDHVASRSARGLIERGVLEAGALYYYKLSAPRDAEPLPPAEQPAPPYRTAVLRELQERSTPVGDVAALAPIFYRRAALEKAELVSRKGAAEGVETGGVLVGALISCPESGEMAVVVEDVLEATHAKGEEFSLNYSSETWARLDKVMRARRKSAPAERILGQAHGHNFDAGEPCAECMTAKVCGKSTAFLSAADIRWCRAVFHSQPWQVSHIFGVNARKDLVDAFYGQVGGALARRGYHILEEAS